MHRLFLTVAALLAALSVALGAFGAHALKKTLGIEALNTFETGVRYQMYHAVALLAVSILYKEGNQKLLLWAGRSFVVGTFLFSGSLYILSLSEGNRWVGIVTPFGGVLFIAGWLLMAFSFSRKVRI